MCICVSQPAQIQPPRPPPPQSLYIPLIWSDEKKAKRYFHSMQVAMAMSVLLHTVVVKMQQCHTRLDRCAHDCRQNSFWYVSALVPPDPWS